MSSVITGSTVLFRASTTGGDVVLKNSKAGYELYFGSDVICTMNASFQTVTLGQFNMSLSDDKQKLQILSLIHI